MQKASRNSNFKQSVWLCPRLVSNDQRTKGSTDTERKQHETLMVYFKGRCNGTGPNSSTLPGLLPCLPSWRFIFPYKSPCCWHAPVCLLHCSYYADSLEGWALPEGLCPAGSCFPDWGVLCSLRISWGLRSTLTQSFQEGVAVPWPPLDLEGERKTVGAIAGGEKKMLGEQRDQERTLVSVTLVSGLHFKEDPEQ